MKNLCLISQFNKLLFVVIIIINVQGLCLYSHTLKNDSINIVNSENTGTTIYNDKIELLPLRDIFDIINYFPSVSLIDNKLITNNQQYNNITMIINQVFIDNHDPAYNTIKINGIDITDKFYGGFGKVDIHKFPVPSVFALKKVDYQKDMFSVLNRNSLGDEINFELKKGDFEKLEVFAVYSIPIAGLYGLMDMNSKFKEYSSKIPEFAKDESRQLQSSGDQNIELGLGLPINLFQKSTAFVSMRRFTKECDAWIDVKDPIGKNLGMMPDQGTTVNNINASFTTKITDDFQFEISSMYGISSWLNSKWMWLYANTEGDMNGLNNGIPERIAKQTAVNFINNYISLKFNYQVSSKLDFALEINKSYQRYEEGRRSEFSSPDFFTGYSILKPHDNYKAENGNLVPGSNKIMDEYELLTNMGTTEDGYLRGDSILINPLTGYHEGASYRNTRNPYGLEWDFANGGSNTGLEYNTYNAWEINLTANYKFNFLNLKHKISSAFNFDFYQYKRFLNLTPYDGNPDVDIHTDEFDLKMIGDLGSKPIESSITGFALQDAFSIGKLNILCGLRIDFWNPNAKYSNGVVLNEIIKDADNKMYISPRLNLIYNLSSYSTLSLGYGTFYKSNTYIYNYGFSQINIWGPEIVSGNPNLDFVKSEILQLNFKTIIIDNWILSLTTYEKWLPKEMGITIYPTVPDLYYQFALDNSFDKSFSYSLSIEKGFGNNWLFNLNHSYTYFKEIRNTNLKHIFNASIAYYLNDNEGFTIFGVNPLENTSLAISSNFRNGFPYTPTDKNGKAIGEINSLSYPDIYELNLKLTKRFNLPDGISGNYKPYIEFSLDIFNLFNFTNELWFDELERVINRVPGDFSSTTVYKTATLNNPSSFSRSQYDAYGKRLYNSTADLDNNGEITQNEKYQAYMNYSGDLLLQQTNRQSPRTVFLNIKIGF
jgi:hypothetical protein